MNRVTKELIKSLFISLWIMVLTFPLLVIKVDTINRSIQWRWGNLLLSFLGAFFLSLLWRWALHRKEQGGGSKPHPLRENLQTFKNTWKTKFQNKKIKIPSLISLGIIVAAIPFMVSMYQTSIIITALMYVVLGLGLNIVVGFGGLLNLGYAAFYAIGAYTYALLYHYLGLGFWVALPLGGLVGAVFGLLIGFPVLRLRGDYLAIVTLAFGEITRMVLENWSSFTMGPEGVANIPRPAFFVPLKLPQATIYLYFIVIMVVLFTLFVIRRLENSRLGRAWEAMREDETACQAMGIDLTRTKLTAFALGAVWAGFAGVIFAAKTTYVNPGSFTIWQSVLILCVVVLGGMGSITGVVFGALLMVLLPEYLRAFSEYRMFAFGIALVIMMIFRPGGFIAKVRKSYVLKEPPPSQDPAEGGRA